MQCKRLLWVLRESTWNQQMCQIPFFFFCLVEVVEKPVFAWSKNMREGQSADLPDKEETDVPVFFVAKIITI